MPFAAGTGSAVAGGVYLAFSVMVMPALRRRPADEAITTMVRINEKAVRAPFMALFFGTAAACAAITVAAAVDPQTQHPLRVAGAAAYLAGWASTMVVNVPLNYRLSANGAAQPTNGGTATSGRGPGPIMSARHCPSPAPLDS